MALFKRFSGCSFETPKAAYEEPPFIAEKGLECRGFSKGNEADLESTTFYSPNDNHDSPAVKRLIEIAEGRGLNVESGIEKKGCQKIFITGEGAMKLMFDFEKVVDAIAAKAAEARAKLPPANLPSNVKWPGDDASLSEHMQYLIDAREYISQMNVSEGTMYVQLPHSGAPSIGDRKRPAVLDASYDYRRFDENNEIVGRVLASISVPDFTPLESDVWQDGVCTRAQGLSLENIGASFRIMLGETGVEVLDIGKSGGLSLRVRFMSNIKFI